MRIFKSWLRKYVGGAHLKEQFRTGTASSYGILAEVNGPVWTRHTL